MKALRRLHVRLLISYLVVGLVSAIAAVGTARALAPTFFEQTVIQQEKPAPTPTPASSPTHHPETPRPSSGSSPQHGPTASARGSPRTTPGASQPAGQQGQPSPGAAGGSPASVPASQPASAPAPTNHASGNASTATPLAETATTTAATTIQALPPDVQRALGSSLNTALLVSLAASLVVSGLLAAFVGRRILRPLDAVRKTTRRLAQGHYGERVRRPAEVELAALADDVNVLADTLAGMEQRRLHLVSDLAHELRTPLSTIEGHMEALLDGVFSAEEVYGTVTAETSRMKRLVGDLGLLSRADEGNVELDLADCDLGDLVTAAAGRLQPQFTDKGVALTIEDPESRLRVRADRDRLTQVLLNLVGNALRYTDRGGSVHIRCGADGGRGLVEVRDSGRGIAAENLERVFERFFRVRSSVDPVSGTGIGLTIARSIARAHGGDVVAASRGLGEGSTFTLSIPLVEQTEAPVPAAQAGSSGGNSSIRQ